MLFMPVYERFADLPVWQEAAHLYNSARDLLQSHKLLLGPGWRLQFERAALSVSNNIAERFERLTPNELRNFLVIARGSAEEVRSMVGVVVRRRETQSHVVQLERIRNRMADQNQRFESPSLRLLSFVICHYLSSLDHGVSGVFQIQRGQQLPIFVHARIGRGQEPGAVEERVGAGKKTKCLRLARESGATGR
jgi:four helix bundle protein